jgi:hypothetical protein
VPIAAPVALIAGGDRQVAPGIVSLDGSRSYDPDGGSSLTFAWTCMRAEADYGKSCQINGRIPPVAAPAVLLNVEGA